MKGVKHGETRNCGYFIKYAHVCFDVLHNLEMLIINGIMHGDRYTNNRYSGGMMGVICFIVSSDVVELSNMKYL